MYLLIDDLLLWKFIQARHASGGIWTKNNLLVPCDGVFDGFFKLFLCFHTVLMGVYSTFLQVLTVMSCTFFISFVTPDRLQKSFSLLFYTSKNPSSSSLLNMLHCWFSASVCLYSSTYTWGWYFFFVCRQNQSLTLPLHCNTYYMKHLDHENLSLCILSTFSTCHGRTCPLLL